MGLAWETDDVIVVNKGLDVGDRLCLTEVPYALEGWPVKPRTKQGVQLVAEVPAEDAPARARPPRPPAGGVAGGIGARIDSMIEAAGDKLPDDLRSKLLAIKESGDFTQMRPVMTEVREWAEANGVEIAGGRGGPGGGGRGGGGPRYAVSNALQSFDMPKT